MSGRPLRGDGVASQMRDAIGQPGLPRISLGRLHGLGKIENGRFELRVCGAECERVGAASTAYVEETLAVAKRQPLRHQPRGAERTGVLSRTEGLAADAARIDHSLVEALVGEDPLSAKRRGKIPETFIAEGAVHEAHIVPEVARRAGDQKFRRRRSVSEPAFVLDDQT